MLELLQNYFSQAPAFGLNAFWISQGLIILALGSDVTAWQCRQRENVLKWIFVSTIFIGVHFYLLDQITAALVVALAGVRSLIAIKSTHKSLGPIFMVLALIIGLLTYKAPVDWLIIVATMIGCFGCFRPTDRELRLYSMVATVLFITYGVIIFSPAMALLDSIFLASNFVGFYRHYIRETKNLT